MPGTLGALLDCNPNNIFYRCVEDSNEAIMISDRDGRMAYVNPAWVRLYGYSREEAIGQTPRLLQSGTHGGMFYREMWGKILDPRIGAWKGELVNRSKGGNLIPVFLTITPVKSPAGENIGFMGMTVDLSLQKELEAKIAHQDRLASLGLLASGLAHEIGTPLGVVRGRAEFLIMQAENPVMKKNLEVITTQIDRISKLIRSLLRVSRNFSDVQMEEVLLVSVIEEVMGLVGQNLREDSVEIRVQLPEGLRVQADFGRLEQVFLNLIMNSIHAIRRAVQHDKRLGPHRLSIEASVAGSQVEIRVTDTGCGIAPEHMKKLFKPFFTTKEVGEGTGLGLAITARLVQEMEGRITVESKVGEGTCFGIVLNLP